MINEKPTQPGHEGHSHEDPRPVSDKKPTAHVDNDPAKAPGDEHVDDPKSDSAVYTKEPTAHAHKGHTHEHDHKPQLFIHGEDHKGHDWGLGNK